jgi:hypothetical protein
VRNAPAEAIVVTNGFSCREQIEQGAGRQTLHIAQLVMKALEPMPQTAPFPIRNDGSQPAHAAQPTPHA